MTDLAKLKAFCQSDNACPVQRASTLTDEAILALISRLEEAEEMETHWRDQAQRLNIELSELRGWAEKGGE